GFATARSRSGRNCHLQYAVSLMREQIIGCHDVIELEAMGNQRFEIGALGCDDVHETAHSFLAAGAEGCDDPVVAEPGCECTEWYREILGVHTQARQRAARPEHSQTCLECRLCTEGFDRHIDTASAGQTHDLGHGIALAEVDDVIGAEALCHCDAFLHRFNG